MKALIWSLPSLRDTQRIFESLEYVDPIAARHVVDAIESSVDRLLVFPFSAPMVGRGPERKISLSRYPYLVFYRVGRADVSVTRVRHTHEDWLPR